MILQWYFVSIRINKEVKALRKRAECDNVGSFLLNYFAHFSNVWITKLCLVLVLRGKTRTGVPSDAGLSCEVLARATRNPAFPLAAAAPSHNPLPSRHPFRLLYCRSTGKRGYKRRGRETPALLKFLSAFREKLRTIERENNCTTPKPL